MASLLFGFDTNVVTSAAPTDPNAMSPIDSTLAMAFEPHIPGPFRPQYSKAVQTLKSRYPKVKPPTQTLPSKLSSTSSTQSHVQVKTESASVTLPLKRESSFLKQESDLSGGLGDTSQLPPQSSQQEFVARVKGKLDQQRYEGHNK